MRMHNLGTRGLRCLVSNHRSGRSLGPQCRLRRTASTPIYKVDACGFHGIPAGETLGRWTWRSHSWLACSGRISGLGTRSGRLGAPVRVGCGRASAVFPARRAPWGARAEPRKPYRGRWLRNRRSSSRSDIALPGLAHGWRARIQMRTWRGQVSPRCWKAPRDRRFCRLRRFQSGPLGCGWTSWLPGLARTRPRPLDFDYRLSFSVPTFG
jgi:hypothetical protein